MAEIVEIPKRVNQHGCFKILLKNCNEEVFKCTDKVYIYTVIYIFSENYIYIYTYITYFFLPMTC